MNDVYILGGAQTDFERNWTKEGKSYIAVLREVIEDTFKETGLSYEQVKKLNSKGKIACFIGNFCAEYYLNQSHLGGMLTEVHPAFYGVPSARYEAACASGSVALDAAMARIRNEDYEVAIVIGIELMKTVDGKTGGDFLGRAAVYEKEARGIDYPFPTLFSQLADEMIRKYNLDEERFLNALAEISTINYDNAKRNPNAQTRKWYMSHEQAADRGTPTNAYIGKRLAASDCSQITDGAACVVLVSKKYLEKNRSDLDLQKIPVVKGWGHRVAPMTLEAKLKGAEQNQYILPWTKEAVDDAYRRADFSVENIDFFETHDCFTSSEYAAISCLGLTEPGKEYEAVEDGIICFEGSQPINPSGGLIGGGHPVGATGVRMFLDLYKQVANKAGAYQVANARNGLMLNIGGSATTNYVFIVGLPNKEK